MKSIKKLLKKLSSKSAAAAKVDQKKKDAENSGAKSAKPAVSKAAATKPAAAKTVSKEKSSAKPGVKSGIVKSGAEKPAASKSGASKLAPVKTGSAKPAPAKSVVKGHAADAASKATAKPPTGKGKVLESSNSKQISAKDGNTKTGAVKSGPSKEGAGNTAKAIHTKSSQADVPTKKSARADASKTLEAPENIVIVESGNKNSDEPFLTDAEGRRYCRVKECDQLSAVDTYCRYHYLLLWKNIQVRKKILTEGKLERYIEELTARYPDKYLDMLRKDMRSEKDFLSAIQELELDEAANESEFEEESFIDEVRGMSSETSMRDDDESF
jgi:hypothetical protein